MLDGGSSGDKVSSENKTSFDFTTTFDDEYREVLSTNISVSRKSLFNLMTDPRLGFVDLVPNNNKPLYPQTKDWHRLLEIIDNATKVASEKKDELYIMKLDSDKGSIEIAFEKGLSAECIINKLN